MLGLIDVTKRRHGDQIGLDTRVVHADKDECQYWDLKLQYKANALSIPPGEYVSNNEIQWN